VVIAAFLVGSAAPIAAFVATKVASGADLHTQRERRAEALAEDGEGWRFCFAMESGAARGPHAPWRVGWAGPRRKIVGRSHCRSGPLAARSPSEKAVGAVLSGSEGKHAHRLLRDDAAAPLVRIPIMPRAP
jgi:hypothetical protein